MKGVRLDNTGELISKAMVNESKRRGVALQSTTPYTSEQNRVVERGNRVVAEGFRVALEDSHLRYEF